MRCRIKTTCRILQKNIIPITFEPSFIEIRFYYNFEMIIKLLLFIILILCVHLEDLCLVPI